MFHKLSIKIASFFSILFILIAVFLNTWCTKYMEQKIINQKISVLYKEAETIGKEYRFGYNNSNIDLSILTTQLKTVDTFINAQIWAVNATGTIIADTRSENMSTPKQNLNISDPGFLNKNYIVGTTINGLLPENSLTVAYTINSNLTIKGYIVIVIPMSTIHSSAMNYINILNYSLILFAAILMISYIFIYFTFTHPLNKLKSGVKQFTDGNFNYELKLNRKDEFSTMATAINYMAHKLQNLEEYQKNFIANISHDFRSPLTSIKGYAQAFLDGAIPKDAEEKYMKIIVSETERLTKLTTNLLTLNNLKYNGTFLTIIRFDINHTIKKTAETFEGIGTKKKISIQLLFSESKLYVCGDIDKIQQILYNLIDNAIKFSPNNSIITISSDEKNDKAFISVKDHGIGIPNDCLPRIWERFYKTDISRGKDKKGTGLGLSIVKEIITAHGENITAISTKGAGTEFVFTLPIAESETD